jgi:IclR family mhp operon transcriptional activator
MEDGFKIRAISRSIAVLQAINRHGSLSMIAIAEQSRVPYPTAVRIVQTFITEGLIEREPSRKWYRATALVQSLSSGYQKHNALVDVSRPHLSAITREIGWPVSLAARIGARMVILDSTSAETSLTFEHHYPGFTIPLLGGAAGRLCFAHMEPEDSAMVLRSWEVSGQHEGETLPPSEAATQAIRDQGYACLGMTPGRTASIAVPIFAHGRFAAALTLIYFAAAMPQQQAIDRYQLLLADRAEAISVAVSARE